MSDEKAYLLALIGLRALVEFDPIEYQRLSDTPKSKLDDQIKLLLGANPDADSSNLYSKIVRAESTSPGIGVTNLLLRQLYWTSMQKSQYESVMASQVTKMRPSLIVKREMKEAGISLPRAKDSPVNVTLDTIDNNFLQDPNAEDPQLILEPLADFANVFAQTDFGTSEQRQDGLWRSCTAVLDLLAMRFPNELTETAFFEAASEASAEVWVSRARKQAEEPSTLKAKETAPPSERRRRLAKRKGK